MPRFIMSFDTEDYICPDSDDMVKSLCGIMDENGIKGSFCMVAERARQLVVRGRSDVIDALKRHEIAFHSTWHSRHPNIAEYLEPLGWAEGVAELMAREAEGIRLVCEIFNVDCLPAAVPPGSSWGPQGVYAYTRVGIPVFAAGPISLATGEPVWFCGALAVPYNQYLDDACRDADVASLRQILDAHRSDEHMITCNHPTFLQHETFVDALNFKPPKNAAPAEWRPAPTRSAPEIKATLETFGEFCRLLSADPDYEQTSYAEIHERYRGSPGGDVQPGDAKALASAVAGGIDAVEHAGEAFSPAEVFGILNFHLANGGEKPSPVRRLLGPAEPPPSADGALVARRDHVTAAARAVEEELRTQMPSAVEVAGRKVPPGTYLKALAQLAADGADGAKVEPGDDSPAALGMDIFGNLKYRWACFAEGFEGENLIRLARLQAWTFKKATAG